MVALFSRVLGLLSLINISETVQPIQKFLLLPKYPGASSLYVSPTYLVNKSEIINKRVYFSGSKLLLFVGTIADHMSVLQ